MANKANAPSGAPNAPSAPTTQAVVTPTGNAPTVRQGFFFGLAGSPVKSDKNDKNSIVDYRFLAKKGETVALNVSNLEVPYPETEAAALAMAQDATYDVHALRDGKYVQVDLTGICAAVAFARDRKTIETIRQRCAAGTYNDETLRQVCIRTYGFIPASVQAARDEEMLTILQRTDLSADEKNAMVIALLVAQGKMQVK